MAGTVGESIGGLENQPRQPAVLKRRDLSLAPDADSDLLADVIRSGTGTDIVMTAEQERAYRRWIRRFVARIGGGGLDIFKYWGDR